MNKTRYFYYSACREHAGLTQEQAAERLHIAVRTISDYENKGNVPDEIVKVMVQVYETAMLGWWHLKNFSPLGDCLPDVSVIDSKGDLIFQVVLTNDLMADVYEGLKNIYRDKKIDCTERADYIKCRNDVQLAVNGLMSVSLYMDDEINKFPDEERSERSA